MTPSCPKASTITASTLARALLLCGLCALAAAAPARRPNRLADEKSPYLQRHAFGPVDWHPWGAEAFAKARRENKPIFLSIGYSTCHWCRVMERESFDDESIAALLNDGFVAVKVDREERPDIDRVYMDAAAAAGWETGWPLNLWLTPELEPFFAGAYFPPVSRSGRLGLTETLALVARTWRTKRDDAVADARRITKALEARALSARGARAPDAASLEESFRAFNAAFDSQHGGFGGAPKFPRPSDLAFLLRYAKRTGRDKALQMAARTLTAMADGAIHDQLGGGFHRYTTDAAWRAPHFEKMLYDNAQLAVVYLEAYQATGDARFARVAHSTLDYLLRDMAHDGGGFYSAEDADESYYLWRDAEVAAVLGERDAIAFSSRYGVGKDPAPLFVAVTELVDENARAALLAARLRRPRPARDDKVLASWNGLALSAFAKGAQVLEEPRYLRAAQDTARFLRAELYDAGANRLYRRWRQGERAIPGFAEDYALTVSGLLDLHEADFDPAWLTWAVRLTEAQLELFYDRSLGSFHASSVGQDPHLPLRPMENSDGDIPAASSVATLNLLRLGALVERPDFTAAAVKTLTRMGEPLSQRPQSLPALLSAVDARLTEPLKIDVSGAVDAPETRALLREVRRRFLPNKTLLFTPRQGRPRASVCRGASCSLPTADPGVLGRLLDGRSVAKKKP